MSGCVIANGCANTLEACGILRELRAGRRAMIRLRSVFAAVLRRAHSAGTYPQLGDGEGGGDAQWRRSHLPFRGADEQSAAACETRFGGGKCARRVATGHRGVAPRRAGSRCNIPTRRQTGSQPRLPCTTRPRRLRRLSLSWRRSADGRRGDERSNTARSADTDTERGHGTRIRSEKDSLNLRTAQISTWR